MKKLAALFTAAIVLAAGGTALAMRPDWRFVMTTAAENTVRSGTLPEKTVISTEKHSLEELNSREDVTFSEQLMLVNPEHMLDSEYTPSLTDYKDTGIYLRREFADAFAELNEDVKNNCGEGLYFSSGYRSLTEQQQIYNEEGADTAQLPGASEHNTGLAADVYVNGFAGEALIKSPAGRYMNENCSRFGIIIRYPLGGKNKTGISYEPWHLRYVGLPHSKIITENGLTLEEYSGIYDDGEWYSYSGYLISHQTGSELYLPINFTDCVISPDNCGGYFITAHK